MRNHSQIISSFLAAVGGFVALNAFAASDYRCTVARRVAAAQESSIVQKAQESTYIGKQFTVERRTGLMAGVLKNSYVTKPQVIDSGSKDNAFKVVTTMRIEEGAGVGSNIYALTIDEYESSEQKPFVFLENDVVYLGTCEHF